MNKRIVVKRVFSMWVGSCPHCGVGKGFMAHQVWDLVRAWAMSHGDKHRAPAEKLDYVERPHA